jgi:hypothetical protein
MFIDELSKPAFWTALKENYMRLEALREELDQVQSLRRKCDTSEPERLLKRELEGYRIGVGHQLQKFETTRHLVESEHIELASDLPILDGITLTMFEPIEYAKACRKVAFAIRAKTTEKPEQTPHPSEQDIRDLYNGMKKRFTVIVERRNRQDKNKAKANGHGFDDIGFYRTKDSWVAYKKAPDKIVWYSLKPSDVKKLQSFFPSKSLKN